MRTFFFHYNKPASLKAGRPQLSVHFKDSCIIVDGVDCRRPCASHIRNTQPRCVMKGKASFVKVGNDGIALIV